MAAGHAGDKSLPRDLWMSPRQGHNTGDVKTVIGDREAGFGIQSPPKRQTTGSKESLAPVDPAAPDT